MARIIDAFQQFFDDNGDPLVDGWLKFNESGTNNTDKDTFADINEIIANANPVPLDGAGRCPNIFGTGTYNIISFTSAMVQIQQFDPVNTIGFPGAFSSWESSTIYDQGDIVIASDDKYYRSIISNNQENEPSASPDQWEEVRFDIILDSISELKAASTVFAGNVFLNGYYGAGDGGGGEFYWDSTSTETDDGGTIIKATAVTTGRWKRLSSGDINAKWFGATGDGIDTTTEQQTAINYCANNRINLYYPEGYYKATKLYFKFDASLNPDFPTDGGRFKVYGDGRMDYARTIDGSNLRTIIELTDSTGDVVVADHPVSPFRLRQFEIEDITFIGDTTGDILNTNGSFKCIYKRLTIYNQNASGGGWNNKNFDANTIDNVLIIGDATTPIAGTGLDLSNEDIAIDGSLSNISRVLVRGFTLGYQFGYERSLGTDGNYQQYNHVSNCASNDCTTGAYFGDRWQNNTFTACQFRGTDTGGLMGSRFNNNKLITCAFDAYDATNAIQGLFLGDGNTAANRQADNNEFDHCIFKSAVAGSPALMWIGGAGASLVLNNELIDCTFEGVNVTLTNAVEFTAAPSVTTGRIIRPKFISYTNEFSHDLRRIDFEPVDKVRNLVNEITTTDATVTVATQFAVNTGEVLTAKATVVAKGTASADHAGYVKQITVYDNAGTATIIGTETDISTQELTAAMDASFQVSGGNLRLRVTGVAATTIDWIVKLEIITHI